MQYTIYTHPALIESRFNTLNFPWSTCWTVCAVICRKKVNSSHHNAKVLNEEKKQKTKWLYWLQNVISAHLWEPSKNESKLVSVWMAKLVGLTMTCLTYCSHGSHFLPGENPTDHVWHEVADWFTVYKLKEKTSKKRRKIKQNLFAFTVHKPECSWNWDKHKQRRNSKREATCEKVQTMSVCPDEDSCLARCQHRWTVKNIWDSEGLSHTWAHILTEILTACDKHS